MHRLRFLLFPALALILASSAFQPAVIADDLDKTFATVPDANKPWAYWWWLNANVTKESITRDLEELKAKGVGGVLLFDVTAYGHHLVPAPERNIPFMSDEWRELVKFAISEAGRLGMQVSINLSTCGGALRAPWDMGEHAVKQLIWSKKTVTGPAEVTLTLPKGQGKHFKPVAVIAARIEDAKEGDAKSAEWTPWATVVSTLPKDAKTTTKVVDLAGNVESDTIKWNVPEGTWNVLRFGMEIIPEREEDVDILNVDAVEDHFNRMGRAIIADAGPLVGKTLTHFYNVSWEGVSPSWTVGFEKDFKKYRGYDVLPYMPVLAGMAVDNRVESVRFLRDYCRTLSDCFMMNCYERFDKLCAEEGLKWHSESGGPWSRGSILFKHADQLQFWGHNAMPQGEYWVPSYRSNVRRTAMAAHVYGKPLASVESFTHMVRHWSMYPAAIKHAADLALIDGLNQFVWHTCSASPKEFGKPGIVYFAGTHLNPNITWWEYAKGFLDYIGRCQHMLRQGHYVADVCVYTSDENGENWTRAREWSKKATLKLPAGYSYDLVNADVIVNRMSVEDGDIVLPDGMRYRMLVVDPEGSVIRPDMLRKLKQLAADGATIVFGIRRPERAPGLTNYPKCDDEVKTLVGELWENKAGNVIVNTPLEDALEKKRILPDFEGTDDYIHRRTDDADIYFVAGSGSVELTFRVSGKQPEIWNPQTGEISKVARYRNTEDGRTMLQLPMPTNGSLFFVFRESAKGNNIIFVTGPKRIEMEGRTGDTVPVKFWQDGRYVFCNQKGKQIDVAVKGVPQPRQLKGPWDVTFAEGWGPSETVQFDNLTPWNESEDPEIKYFSGTAVYRKSFDLSDKEAAGQVKLSLGRVCYIAKVRVNGKDLGTVWTHPWTVDLTGAVKPGENELEIEVANTWVNRLVGDAGLPEEKRRTNTNVVYEKGKRTLRVFQSFGSEDPLMPSGLLGPVGLEFGVEKKVEF